jgi:nucleoside-diphosphate-sugar epimerase
MEASMAKTILVLGATGGVGGAVARAFLNHGWRVKALSRRPEEAAAKFPPLKGVAWIGGDAMKQADVVHAADGTDAIFHGAHPAKYQHWEEWGVPMLRHGIAAAKANGARLIFPGNIYNFGPDAGAFVSETAPQNPPSEKGKIRVRMEDLLKDAALHGVRSLVVRANDYFGPHSPSSWFGGAMVKPGKPLRSVTYPGARDVGHGFAYLPDLAEAIARLMENQAKLTDFEVVHFGGHWFERGVEFAQAVGRAAGRPDLPVRRFPWFAVFLARPFVPMLREIWRMRYLWREPLRLDNTKLVALIGPEPHTPIDQALRTTLEDLGCMPETHQAFTRPVAA